MRASLSSPQSSSHSTPNPLPERIIWSVLAHVAAALAHLHSSGVVHLDVKADNIFLGWATPPPNAPSGSNGGGGAGSGLGSRSDVDVIGGGWALPAGSDLFAPPPLLRQAAATFGPLALAAAPNAGQRADDRRP